MHRLRRAVLAWVLAALPHVAGGLPAAAESWWVYRDAGAPENHGAWTNVVPAAAAGRLRIDLADLAVEGTPSGGTDVRLDFDLMGAGWAGIIVASEPGFWGDRQGMGYDLGRAQALVFRARGLAGGERIRVKAALSGDQPFGDVARLPLDGGWIALGTAWQEIRIPVAGRDLSRVITPFAVVANDKHNPSGRLTVFLDDIRYELRDGPAEQKTSFLDYLHGEAPALVAYVPAGYDPDHPPPSPLPAERLRADLAALRPAFDGLVLYEYREQLTPAILEQAAALGYRAVLLGIWQPRNDVEVMGTAELVRRWRDRMTLAVCIGNEGINENLYQWADVELARDRLRRLARPSAPVPVTTTEPSGDYGWAPLQAFGDFLAPNIHPAIDQAQLAPEAAVAWTRARAEAIGRLAGKPVLVKETGLPNGGAEGQSPERQRLFWTNWLAQGRTATLESPGVFASYAAAFEAFDTPWKAIKLANPIEGHWGLMSVDRVPYPAFAAWVSVAAGPRRPASR